MSTWLVLAWIGAEHAAMWGLLAGIFNSIPYFGPVIVSGGLFVVGMVQGGGLTQALQMAGTGIVHHQVQPPRGRDSRIELSNRARCRIPGIGE